MSKPVLLIGMGGHSKVIKDIIENDAKFYVAGYLDDAINDYHKEHQLIYDNLKRIDNYKNDYYFVIAIGDNFVREKIFIESHISIEQFPVLIHSTACVSPSASIGYGTVVMPLAVVNADTTIGVHSIVNTSSVIEHDNVIGDYVHISPNAVLAGGVEVGAFTHIALNTTVLPQVNIGKKCVVGAGSTVIKDVKSESTVIGTPAKIKE
ncbi:acetyltransferase [Staphylococcus saccharolyticus]|uniref:acetyltransferase n=1 Tax=Staphylococcus saccharolyticus TaxID=33028 RepID=UPI00102E0ACB|nr:acetyltransferase [Staphylococcus saccharolyticus]MBL7573814.1 acetyltransferase [Staphylococcus saccharolyticus]MBL7584398.1 acetyltransferase [Staphylococcus saccharolyticus]MBL7639261.1 acetyltransferase [Staphylococcus saccharolyticus]QRJ68584.1 acetyltransferase [Staphylococcus saccharolyticus]TAA91900.1 acetyltransferase [Staphylococcus saccharolyticus]